MSFTYNLYIGQYVVRLDILPTHIVSSRLLPSVRILGLLRADGTHVYAIDPYGRTPNEGETGLTYHMSSSGTQ